MPKIKKDTVLVSKPEMCHITRERKVKWKKVYLLSTAEFLTKCLIWFRINSVHSRKGENYPVARVLPPSSAEEANCKKGIPKSRTDIESEH